MPVVPRGISKRDDESMRTQLSSICAVAHVAGAKRRISEGSERPGLTGRLRQSWWRDLTVPHGPVSPNFPRRRRQIRVASRPRIGWPGI